MMPDIARRRLRTATVQASLCALVAAITAGPALAQAAPSGGSDSAAPAEEIIVTGSRLARSTFNTPTPVTVLGGDDMQKLGVVNVGQAVAQLPAFRPSTTPATQGFGSFNVGANIVNLRGLGVTRNLILVDGRRFAPTTREGSVDLNLIPSILVARTEVVTGGGSAAYGSDALAGVVNVILDSKLNGLKAQVDYGVSDSGDGDDYHAGLAFGSGFAGGAGHFVIGGEYDDQKGIGNCFTRKWCTPGAVVTNAGFATNGLPNYVRTDTNGGFFFNPGGVVLTANAPSGGVTFGPDGSLQPYTRGSLLGGLSAIGGSLYPSYTDANISVPVKRYTGYAHADFEISDRLSAFVEGSYGHVRGVLLQTAYFTSALPIYRDNPYIPTALRTLLGSPGAPGTPLSSTSLGTERPAASSFSLAKVFDDLARGLSISTADTYRGTAGLSGKLGGNWKWDGYYQYGETDRLQTVANNLVTGDPTKPLTSNGTYAQSNARFYFALDAVTNPATGQPTCRALLSTDAAVRAAAAGCVPINLFGAGNVGQAGKNYVYATLSEDIKLQQHVLSGNIRGDLGELWAGPISVALGAEYRVDKINVVHDALSNLYAYFQNFGSDYNGTSKVVEGYGEVELPLIKDASFTKSLSLNGAVRQTHYDITGFGSYLRTGTTNKFNATAWKISALWEPVDWVRLRATRSRDIRAPNFADLFLASAGSFTPVTNRFNGNASQVPSIFNGGSPRLKPEKASTTTLGLVLSPRGGALNGFRFSVDAYKIVVKDYISAVPGGAQFIMDKCFAGVSAACGLLTFTGANNATLTQVLNVNVNLDYIKTRGIDFEADYRIPLGADRTIQLRGLATYVDYLKSAAFGDVVDRAGQTGNSAGLAAPKWTLNGFVTFSVPRAMLTVQGRYIDKGVYDAQRIGPGQAGYATTLINSISDNSVASRFYVNLSGSYHVGPDKTHGFELFGAINNLFNKAPPAAPETQFYTNPVYFDTIGRYYRMGVRARF
jgi:outer membrane receptor protein involved in Fe transport